MDAIPAERRSLLDQLGPHARRRAAPRHAVALAAAGCSLAVLGALIISGDRLGAGGGDGASRLPGVVLSAAVVAAGLVLLQRSPRGPLAAAGSVAATLGVPPLLFFLTWDGDRFPPYSTEAILLVSTVAWAAMYVVGPARGRPLHLGAACVGAWATALELAEGVFTFPFGLVEVFAASLGTEDPSSGPLSIGTPDPMGIAAISLLFGATYLLVARQLDRRGLAGAATPCTVAALVCLPIGVLFLADELEALGAGLVGAAIGFFVAGHGADVGRRATTWLGAAGAAFGLFAVVGDLIDEATPGGIALVVVGGGVVVGAEALRRATDEPDELADPNELSDPAT